jgi:Uma2 family endonuclease
MATTPAFRTWTYEEFAQLPNDGNRYEVIAGELVVSPSPSMPHQELVFRLAIQLRLFADEHQLGRVVLGPADVLFGPGDYLEPDLLFVRRDRHGIISERGIEEAPDLVIEVLSPSTSFRDRGIKLQRYAHFGVPEYWILDPRKQQVEVHRPAEDATNVVVLTAGMLEWRPVADGPALQIDVAALFRDLE